MSIRTETQGFFDLDPESIEQKWKLRLCKVNQAGRTISSLASAYGKGALSMDSLHRAVYHNTDQSTAINKMKPDFPELVAIVQKCKFEIATNTTNGDINKDDRNAPNASFAHTKIGDSERLYQEDISQPISQMAGYWKWGLAKC